MLSGANLLLLDEPTNHLDISSREALEAALEDYEGTMLIITHDRYLVNRMADRILYMEEDGLTEYIGGYDDYLEAIARRPQPSAEAASPKAEKPNSYKAQKERQSILNRAAGAVRRAEERIAAAEQELEDINQKLASPAVASDYVKSAELAKKADVVMDGRDIGTVVLPDAQVKVYLTASVATRAKRRYDELSEKGQECNLEKIEADIEQRDYQDMHRENSPLRQAEDATLVDSSNMSIEEVVAAIKKLYEDVCNA